jgi:hypothetical protein
MEQTSKRLTDPVKLFVGMEKAQHEALRRLAYEEHRSLADVVRQALTEFLARQSETMHGGRGDGAESPEDTPKKYAVTQRVYYTPFHARMGE